jgi:DNA-binding MarR family transcriptional regulator
MIGEYYDGVEMAGYPRALAGRVGFLLARAHLIARAKADAALAELGLSMKAYAALATVASDGVVSQQALSRRIGMDPATMVDVIDSLEQSGYIVRNRNPRDRREYALRATAKGRALFGRAERAVGAAEAETLGGMKPDERRMLMQLLGRIANPETDSPATDDMVARALGR